MTIAGNGDLADIVDGYRVIGFQGQDVSPKQPSEGAVYVYHGEYPNGVWYPDVIGSMTIPLVVYVGSQAPPGPVNGTLWWDDISGNLYIYYCDPNSCQWVVTNSIPAQTPITGSFVASFNGRSGVVVLSALDVVAAFTVSGAPQLANSIAYFNVSGALITTSPVWQVAPNDNGLLIASPPGSIAANGYGAYLSLQLASGTAPPPAGTEIGGGIYWEFAGGAGGAEIDATAAAAWFGTSMPTNLNFYTCPVNSTAKIRNMVLDSAGGLSVSSSLRLGSLSGLPAGTTPGSIVGLGSAQVLRLIGTADASLAVGVYDTSTAAQPTWVYLANGGGAIFSPHNDGTFDWNTVATGPAGAAAAPQATANLDASGNFSVASSLAVAGAGQGLPVNMAAGHLVNTNPEAGTDDWVIITAFGGTHLAANAYYDAVAATWRYLSSGAASKVTTFSTGAVGFYSAPAGVAGAPLTFSETAHVDAAGNFLAAKNLEVAGAVTQPSNMAEGHVVNGTPGGSGAYLIVTAVDGSHLVGNAYFDGSQWRYFGGTTESGVAAASRVTTDSTGAVSFYNAPDGGVAGAVATFSQIARLSAGGDLTVNQSLLVGGSAVPTGLYGAHVINTAAFIAMAGQGGAHLFDGVYYNGSSFISLRAGSSLSRMQLSSAAMAVFTNPAVAVGGTVPFSTPATFNLTAAGNLTIAGALTQGGSDVRLKENIGPAREALHAVRALELIEFDYKDGGGHRNVGFSAQDLKFKIPEAVPEPPDVVWDELSGPAPEEPMLGFNLEPLVSYCLKSIQELADHVDRLQRRVFELERQLREIRPN